MQFFNELEFLSLFDLVCFFVFLQLWHQYDTDNSGYIEADELKVKYKINKGNKCRSMVILPPPSSPIFNLQ